MSLFNILRYGSMDDGQGLICREVTAFPVSASCHGVLTACACVVWEAWERIAQSHEFNYLSHAIIKMWEDESKEVSNRASNSGSDRVSKRMVSVWLVMVYQPPDMHM